MALKAPNSLKGDKEIKQVENHNGLLYISTIKD